MVAVVEATTTWVDEAAHSRAVASVDTARIAASRETIGEAAPSQTKATRMGNISNHSRTTATSKTILRPPAVVGMGTTTTPTGVVATAPEVPSVVGTTPVPRQRASRLVRKRRTNGRSPILRSLGSRSPSWIGAGVYVLNLRPMRSKKNLLLSLSLLTHPRPFSPLMGLLQLRLRVPALVWTLPLSPLLLRLPCLLLRPRVLRTLLPCLVRRRRGSGSISALLSLLMTRIPSRRSLQAMARPMPMRVKGSARSSRMMMAITKRVGEPLRPRLMALVLMLPGIMKAWVERV